MNFSPLAASKWLSDRDLSPEGRQAREDYHQYCRHLDQLGLPSYQVARSKYLLQSLNYHLLPDGYALPPHTINLCVNNICNLRCSYCDFGQGNQDTFYHRYNVVDAGSKIELDLDVAKDIIDQAAWFKPVIRASFREPLLYSDLLPLIEYTKQKGLPFWLLTNGFNLSKTARDLVELGVDSIRLSLDGPAHIHDKVRGVPNAYSRMMKGLKLLLEHRRRTGSDMQVGFYFTLNDQNQGCILDTVEQLEAEGVLDQVFMNFQWLLYTTEEMARRHNQTDGPLCGGFIEQSTVQNVEIESLDLSLIHEQYQAIREKYPAEKGYRLHFRPSFESQDLARYRDTTDFPVERPRCKVPWYNLNINPAGEVKSFHHCLLPGVGNIHQQSVMDIWNGEALRSQRQLLQERGAFVGCARCWGVYSLLEDAKRAN